jgi:hypothetical protein
MLMLTRVPALVDVVLQEKYFFPAGGWICGPLLVFGVIVMFFGALRYRRTLD